jgi:uridine phosphorylase
MHFPDSELIINPDGSIYHLNIKPEQIAPTIITVGDPNRVGEVSKHFDNIEHKIQHREFVTHTGILKGQPISVISTGIGTDNIDIVMTELDALVNIDFATRETKSTLTSLNIIRIGTSGSIQPDIPLDSFVISEKAVGLDNLMHFYDAQQNGDELVLADILADYLEKRSEDLMLIPYVFNADKSLLEKFNLPEFIRGTTLTAPGFYAPQGRLLRGRSSEPKLLKILTNFKHKDIVLTNLEMETAGIYGMARLFNHKAISISAILANRSDNTFSQQAPKSLNSLIKLILNIIVS